ncbi:Uncharacterized protein conserved in bacteria [Kingella potus]|uniref:Uncharacterized protein conserved in bacteria n=2 Tax=Kingella potus TaxID=265175 RepID=A0A377R3H6_9NEIS|nr:Uncharacterized protein conserved in bacteria [Kingella potus]
MKANRLPIRSCLFPLLAAALAACSDPAPQTPPPASAAQSEAAAAAVPTPAAAPEMPSAETQPSAAHPSPPLVAAARAQIGQTVSYDPAYTKLDYPMGDVPLYTGVCTDVLIRALRQQGVDLQQLVHEDMRRHFSAYPQKWGLSAPDPNIDHRRVPNLAAYFERQGYRADGRDFRAGDIVTWNVGGGRPHIGIVSDRSSSGRPLVIHNIGRGTREEDILYRYPITGHYRLPQQGAHRP